MNLLPFNHNLLLCHRLYKWTFLVHFSTCFLRLRYFNWIEQSSYYGWMNHYCFTPFCRTHVVMFSSEVQGLRFAICFCSSWKLPLFVTIFFSSTLISVDEADPVFFETFVYVLEPRNDISFKQVKIFMLRSSWLISGIRRFFQHSFWFYNVVENVIFKSTIIVIEKLLVSALSL